MSPTCSILRISNDLCPVFAREKGGEMRWGARVSRRSTLAAGGALCVLLAASCSSGSATSSGGSATAGAGTYHTIAPGTVTVGVYQDGMPYIGISNGKLTGLDGELVNMAAAKLGLKVKPAQVGTAFITDVQVRRVDMTVGDIGWRADRAATGLFTDPPYYSPVAGAVRVGTTVPSYLDLKKLQIGGLTGDFFLPALQCLHVTLHGYDSDAAALEDLEVGRIGIFLHDALTLQSVKQAHPNLRFSVVYPSPPSSQAIKQCPGLADLQPFMTGWFVNKQEPKLAASLTKIIDGWYGSGTLAQIIKKWGGNPSTMLVPQPYFTKQRIGVDRSAGWTAPSISGS
jgi:polar amino acid transport system substrate-binding protein